ncbi:30S ribosomal protein S19e [Candidatus Woesearchaeota archaeon]|nr:30S ribosomal protein S19e [Candidatus Woesearchaeota archaeon]
MIYDIDQQKLIIAASAELKNHIEMPEWALYAKTGPHRETMPKNPDWWYIRAASILRMCYKEGPVGVSKLRTRYGGRQNRGYKPDKFTRAGGKVIRAILQQLETAKLVKQHTVGTHKGRITTPAGISILAKAAKTVGKAIKTSKPVTKPSPKPAKEEAKAEKPKAEDKAEKQEATKEEKTAKQESKQEVKAEQQKTTAKPDTEADKPNTEKQKTDRGAK